MNSRAAHVLLATLCSLWLAASPAVRAQDQRRADHEGGRDHDGYRAGGYTGRGYGGGFGYRQPGPPVYAGRSGQPGHFRSQAFPPQPYPTQPYPTQPYPTQPYPTQPYPTQPYPGQAYSNRAYSGQSTGRGDYFSGANAPPPGSWRNEQDEARQAVREGRHIPLGQAIQSVRRRTAGRELDANLEPGPNGRPVYRLRWAAADGRRIDYLVDAATGAVLSAQGGR